MKFYNEESYLASQETASVETQLIDEIGCNFCWDKKRKKEKELFFLDAANNMRICKFCPYCGREYNEEE